jgi:hypothetical protein
MSALDLKIDFVLRFAGSGDHRAVAIDHRVVKAYHRFVIEAASLALRVFPLDARFVTPFVSALALDRGLSFAGDSISGFRGSQIDRWRI